MAAKHEVVFEWPHKEPSEVIVTGTFNEWARTHRLTEGASGFSGTAHVPWGTKTAYKFIVDGEWALHDGQPTEADAQGNINHVYVAPPEPDPEPAPAPMQGGASQTEGTKEDLPTEKDVVGGAAGGGSATGADVGNLKGDQTAVPKDLPSPESTAPAPSSAEVPAPSNTEDAPIPSWIVPVNAAENNTSAVEASAPAESRIDEPQEPRTIVPEPAEAGATVIDVAPTPVAKEEIEGEQEPGVVEKEDVAGKGLSHEGEQEDAGKSEEAAKEEAAEEASKPIGESDGVAEEALAPVSTADELAPQEAALLVVAPGGAPEREVEPYHIDTPQVNTPDSDLNPSSVTAPQETPVGAAAAAEDPAIDTPQVRTPDSDLNPSSVTAPQEVPAAAHTHAEEQKQEQAREPSPPAGAAAVLVVQGAPAEVAVAEGSSSQPEPQPEAELAEKLDEDKGKPAEVPEPEPTAEAPVAAPAPQSEPAPTAVEAAPQANGTTPAVTEVAERPRTPHKTDNVHAQELSSSTTAFSLVSASSEGKKYEVPATPPKEAPSTPTKRKATFPSQGSPSPSPSPSKLGSGATRKKRPSLFGKIKHLFDSDKEKDKGKVKK